MYYLNKIWCWCSLDMFLRTKFICIIWTDQTALLMQSSFLRTKFICIIWTEQLCGLCWYSSWGLSLFVLFELTEKKHSNTTVLEGWIYLYYLNFQLWRSINWFNFMCTSWSFRIIMLFLVISWLSLFLVNFILFSWLPYT